MAAPTGFDVAAFLGKPEDAATRAFADRALQIVTPMIRSYTRGQGFTGDVPADDIAAVLVTATARLMSNREQLEVSRTKGPFAVEYRSAFDGYTVAETFVLNRYRARAL